MIAYHSAVLTYKIMNSGKPSYLAQKFQQNKEVMPLRGNLGKIQQANKKLSIVKEGFVCRGATLLNKLDDNLRNETKLDKFKNGMKSWAKKNIAIKPSSKHPQFVSHKTPKAQPRPVQAAQQQN